MIYDAWRRPRTPYDILEDLEWDTFYNYLQTLTVPRPEIMENILTEYDLNGLDSCYPLLHQLLIELAKKKQLADLEAKTKPNPPKRRRKNVIK